MLLTGNNSALQGPGPINNNGSGEAPIHDPLASIVILFFSTYDSERKLPPKFRQKLGLKNNMCSGSILHFSNINSFASPAIPPLSSARVANTPTSSHICSPHAPIP